jgi:sec-independent protein translocase protein TatA
MKLFEPGGLIVILIVVLVIFGPSQLPKLAKTIGQSSKALRDGMEGKLEDESPSATADEPASKSADAS